MADEAITTKTRAVVRLDRSFLSEKSVTFISEDDEENGRFRFVSFDRQSWVDMGSPDECVLTLEPGNLEDGQEVAG